MCLCWQQHWGRSWPDLHPVLQLHPARPVQLGDGGTEWCLHVTESWLVVEQRVFVICIEVILVLHAVCETRSVRELQQWWSVSVSLLPPPLLRVWTVTALPVPVSRPTGGHLKPGIQLDLLSSSYFSATQSLVIGRVYKISINNLVSYKYTDLYG